jgi:hypothetical protein
MAYVLDERHGEEASGKTTIEARGIAHHIAFAVDHIRQEPKIRHSTKSSPVVRGTKVTLKFPTVQYGSYEVDLIEDCKERFLEHTESYAWLNPPRTLGLALGSLREHRRLHSILQPLAPHTTKVAGPNDRANVIIR